MPSIFTKKMRVFRNGVPVDVPIAAMVKGGSDVLSVFGRVGNVVAQRGDYTAEMVGAEALATIKESSAIPSITDEATFRTYFYNLRKSANRKYQFEISQGGIHENIVTGVGGRPTGADPRDQAFIYVDIPYSEAGGYIIHVTYELRSRVGLWEKSIYATLNSRWQDTGWIAAEDRTPLVVTVGKEGSGGYKADYNSTDILAAAQAHRAVIMRYTDTDSGLQTDVLLKGQSGGLPLFYDTWLSKDGKTVNRIDATVDYNGNVNVTTKAVDLSGYVQTSTKGKPNGVASLDGGGKVPVAQLPAIPGAYQYQAVLTTSWSKDTSTGISTQTVSIPGVKANQTVIVAADYQGDNAAYVNEKNQFLLYVTNGYAESGAGNVTFHIYGEQPTIPIHILVVAFATTAAQSKSIYMEEGTPK